MSLTRENKGSLSRDLEKIILLSRENGGNKGKSPYFENEFVVRQGHHSFRNVSNIFRTGGVSKGVLQCRTSQLDGAKYLIYYTLSL